MKSHTRLSIIDEKNIDNKRRQVHREVEEVQDEE